MKMMHISYALSKGIARPAYSTVINEPSSFVYASNDGIQLIQCLNNEITESPINTFNNEAIISLGAVSQQGNIIVFYGSITPQRTYMLHCTTIKGDIAKGIELSYMPSTMLYVFKFYRALIKQMI
jgi:hypothetical protein